MTRGDPRRLAELVALPALIAVGVAVPVPLAGELPGRLATHWNANGDPNGSLPRDALWLGTLALWLGLWGLLAWLSRREDVRGGGRMPGAMAILGTGGLLAGTSIATAVANSGEGDWHAAEASPVTLLVTIYAGAGLAAAGAWWCERGRRWGAAAAGSSSGPGWARPTVELGGLEQAVWIGRARSTRMLAGGVLLGTGLASATLLSGPPAGWVSTAAGALAAVAVVWASEVHLVVTATGVRLAFGPLGAPSRFIPLEAIESVEAIHVEPRNWGGWGYRRGRGYTGVIVRRGPGVLIGVGDGRRLAVTVDGATQAAGLLNDLLARRP